MQKGTRKLPRHGELPEVLLQLTQLAEPLKALLRNDTLWCWETKYHKVFEAIKDELTQIQC